MELALSMAAGELQLLAEAGHVEPRVTYGTTSLCDAFGGPDIDPKQATRIVLKAVLIEGDECQRRALPWHFAKRFTEAFATLTTCRGRTRPAAPDERTATGQFTAGWHAAEPFFPEAHRACGLEDTVPGAPAKRRRRGPKGVPADPSSAASTRHRGSRDNVGRATEGNLGRPPSCCDREHAALGRTSRVGLS
jgi:hypothetical protein